MPTLNRYAAPQSTHFPGCWRYAGHHLCTVALVEELAVALVANMAWTGMPSTGSDSNSKAAWEMGKAVLAKMNEEEAESGSD